MTQGNERQKPNWPSVFTNIVGVAGLIGLAFTVYGYFNPINPEKKDLTIRPTVQSAIIKDEIANGLEFTVNGVRTNNVYLNEVELVNSGNVPILKEDFYESRPIIVNFGRVCKILNVSFTASPDTFRRRLKISSEGGRIVIQPTLINSGDAVVIKAITADCGPTFIPLADIEGISEISQNWTIEEPRRLGRELGIFTLVAALWMFFATYLIPRFYQIHPNTQTLLVVGGLSVIVIGAMLLDKTPKLVDQIPAICRDIYNEARSNLDLP